MKKQIQTVLKSFASSMTQIILILCIFLGVFLGFNFGAHFNSGRDGATGAEPHDAGHFLEQENSMEETIWTCSMHPQIQEDRPGKCIICGMDLVPGKVTRTKKRDSSNPVGFACAMNCVQPMEQPGECPICGMEMLPVFDDVNDSSDSARTMVMSEEAKALAAIQTTAVERKWVEHEIRMVGTVDYDETRLARVSAYVGGRLDRLYVGSKGTRVRRDDHMVYLYSPELLSAQEELLQAKRAYENLADSKVSSIRDTSRKALDAARERLRLWGITDKQIRAIEERNSREDHLTIYAPTGGIVIEKHVNEGDYVKSGDRIYTIADLSHLWVQFDAYESDLPWLRFGQDMTFTTEAYPGQEFHGRISFIDPTLNSMTRTVRVRVNVKNSDQKLKPGMYVRGVVRSRLAKGGLVIEPDLAGKWISPMHPEIIRDKPGQCDVCGMDLVPAEELGFVTAVEDQPPLVIPVTAPLVTGKRAVVYLEVPGQDSPTYEGRVITLGLRAGDYYIILDGLTEGDRVVTRGAFRIDSALQIIAKTSMMNPTGGEMTQSGHAHHQSAGQDHSMHQVKE
jgi:Cu(I)/Ag(I) efflux system membrane fusion protein